MKSKISLFIILPVLAILVAGCSSQALQSKSSADTTDKNAVQNPSRDRRMPDFGQPDRQADLRGVVTSIVGNEVTVLEIAANQGRRASSTPESGNASGTQSAPTLSLNGGSTRVRGAAGGFGGPDGGSGRDGAGMNDRAAMLANLKAMSTGQAKVIVPVGIKMMKSESGADGKRTMVEASLTDITADKMITVWLNTSVTDKKIADFILIN